MIYRAIAATFRWIRAAIFNVLIFLLFVFLIGALTSGPPEPQVLNGSVLVLDFEQSLVEDTTSSNPILDLFLSGANVGGETSVRDVVRALEHAADDSRIVAVDIRPQNLLSAGVVNIERVGDAIREFKESGKKVVAYSDSYTQTQYFLASHADHVGMHPYGELILRGLAFESQFYHSLIERLHVNFHIYRAGDFKSAVEPYLRDDMSPEVKESYAPILNQVWGNFLGRIAENRQLSPDQMVEYTENLAAIVELSDVDLANITVQRGLVDVLVDAKEFREQTIEAQIESDSSRMSPRVVLNDYLQVIPAGWGTRSVDEPQENSAPLPGRVGIVTVQGAIFDLPILDDNDDESSTVSNINRAANSNIDALVLRINSPGGSVLASEEIRKALREVSEKGIPIIASMGDTAASGGYWIAAEADLIMASESTITGSIGVFAFYPTFENTLANFGVNTDGAYSSPNAARRDFLSGVSEADAALMQLSIDDTYDKFLLIVSQGRDMSVDDVRAIAGGRIWTGTQAIANNLVDELGELDDALDAAARLANLSSYRVREFKSSPPGLFDSLMGYIGTKIPGANSELGQWIRNSHQQTFEFLNHAKPRKAYALCEACTTGVSL